MSKPKTTVTHGANSDCYMVTLGKWKWCKGHPGEPFIELGILADARKDSWGCKCATCEVLDTIVEKYGEEIE